MKIPDGLNIFCLPIHIPGASVRYFYDWICGFSAQGRPLVSSMNEKFDVKFNMAYNLTKVYYSSLNQLNYIIKHLYYYHCWKLYFAEYKVQKHNILWWTDQKYSIYLKENFSKIINVFTTTFDKLNASCINNNYTTIPNLWQVVFIPIYHLQSHNKVFFSMATLLNCFIQWLYLLVLFNMVNSRTPVLIMFAVVGCVVALIKLESSLDKFGLFHGCCSHCPRTVDKQRATEDHGRHCYL